MKRATGRSFGRWLLCSEHFIRAAFRPMRSPWLLLKRRPQELQLNGACLSYILVRLGVAMSFTSKDLHCPGLI